MNYKNALEILPRHLMDEIRKYHVGLLWIPDDSNYYRERNLLIRELRAKGESVKKIAKLVNLCEERVRQIVNERKTQK